MRSIPVRLSRRAILVAVGLTPAILASMKASAGDTGDIVTWAQSHGVAPDDLGKFVLACSHLWNACVFAMGGAQKLSPSSSLVLATALGKSGGFVKDKLGKFPPDGYDEGTMGCGGVCGYFCSQGAIEGKVTPEVFAKAWDQAYAYFHPSTSNPTKRSGLAC